MQAKGAFGTRIYVKPQIRPGGLQYPLAHLKMCSRAQGEGSAERQLDLGDVEAAETVGIQLDLSERLIEAEDNALDKSRRHFKARVNADKARRESIKATFDVRPYSHGGVREFCSLRSSQMNLISGSCSRRGRRV